MATKQQALTALASVGAELDERHTYGRRVTADAPTGFVFAETGSHSLVFDATAETEVSMTRVWGALAEWALAGVEPCTEDECDVCP
jgi:hypothetical protein